MSRSYRKTPGYGQSKQKWSKSWANRRVRHRPMEDMYNHKSYRKVFDSYDIADPYRVEDISLQEFIKRELAYHQHMHLMKGWSIPSVEELQRKYYLCYLRK